MTILPILAGPSGQARKHAACPTARGECCYGEPDCLPTAEAWEALHAWSEELDAKARFDAEEDWRSQNYAEKHFPGPPPWYDDLGPEGTGEP